MSPFLLPCLILERSSSSKCLLLKVGFCFYFNELGPRERERERERERGQKGRVASPEKCTDLYEPHIAYLFFSFVIFFSDKYGHTSVHLPITGANGRHVSMPHLTWILF